MKDYKYTVWLYVMLYIFILFTDMLYIYTDIALSYLPDMRPYHNPNMC